MDDPQRRSVGAWEDRYQQLLSQVAGNMECWVVPSAAAVGRAILTYWRVQAVATLKESAPKELARAANISGDVSWDALSKRCRAIPAYKGDTEDSLQLVFALLAAAESGALVGEGTAPTTSTVQFSADLVAAARGLLSCRVDELVLGQRPPGVSHRDRSNRVSSEPPAPTDDEPAQLRVRCLREAREHRALVVGEMPEVGLFPAAFVSPEDVPDTWFMQGDPLVEGRAFAALVCFGNPGLVAHGTGTVSNYRLRVVARRRPWPLDYRATLTDAELKELSHGASVWPEPGVHPWNAGRVERTSPPIRSISVDMQGGLPLSLSIPTVFAGHSPARITWSGSGDVLVQIRTAERDQRVWAGRVTTGELYLRLAGTTLPPVTPKTAIELPSEHRQFRVQFYAKSRLVLDPIAELWLDFGSSAARHSLA